MRSIRCLLAALMLVAIPAQAEILFATDFDDYPDFEGAGFPAPNPTTKNCGVEDDPQCSDRCPFAEDGESCAYIGGSCGGPHCSVTISDVGTSSGKAFQHWTGAGGSGAYENDGIVYWFPEGADHTVTYPELWVEVKVKFPPNFQWVNDSVQQKLLRISYHPGRGARQGDFSYGDCTFTSSYGCQRPSVIVDVGKYNSGNSDLYWLFAPRTHVSYGSGADHVYFENKYGTRYCNGSSGSTCIPGGDESACPGSCNGSVVGDANYNGTGFDWGMAGHLGTDAWHTWRFRMKANTMGQSNGIFEAYHNGQLQFSRTNYQFFENTQTVRFENGPTQTNKFWTGNSNPLTPGFNMVALGGNTTNTPNQEQWYAYDDFCVATSQADLANCFGPQVPACSDGIDNDGDGLTDAGDPGCSGDTDTSEKSASLVCDDGNDNDGDGSVDMADTGCSSPSDTTEADCGDGVRNGSEVCDGSDLGGADCTDEGFVNPFGLACASSCNSFDTSACTNEQPLTECMTFDESDDYIRLADSSDLTLPDGDWTVGIFAKAAGNGGSAYKYAISSNGTTDPNSFNLYMNESNNAWTARVLDGGGAQMILDGSAQSTDEFTMLVARRRADTLSLLYCTATNCSEEASTTVGSLGSVDAGAWNLGRRIDADTDRYFGGELCHFFVVPEGMSDGELANYAKWIAPVADRASAYLGADLQTDLSGNGNDGQSFGGPLPSPVGPNLQEAFCGNDDWEAGENCDGSDLAGETCESQAAGTGSLACNSQCGFDQTGCSGQGSAPGTVGGVTRTDTTQ